MAIEDSNTVQEIIESKPTAAQIDAALNQITSMALALTGICFDIIQVDENGNLSVAAATLATQIGWTADRCLGFQLQSSDGWMNLPAGGNSHD